jgi:hypothetical protein
MRSDQGTLFATVQGTVTPSAGGALRSRGNVVFRGGTGNYDGAEGTATFTDNLDTSGGGRVSNVTIRGEVEF